MTLKFIGSIMLWFLIVGTHGSDTESTVDGLIPVGCDTDLDLEVPPQFPAKQTVKFFLYGDNLRPNIQVGITKDKSCNYVDSCEYEIRSNTHGHLAVISLTTPRTEEAILKMVPFYLCVMSHNGDWMYQGDTDAVTFYVYEPLLTNFVIVVLIILCFLMSSIMSGLNIGLMSLDMNELNLIKNAGSEKEKKYARKIIPVRKNGNFLLCSILITATLCNSVATVCIDRFVSDWIAVTISTIVIVLVCEIIPQSLCTYFPLSIGAYTVYITKLCMILTAPASYPLSMILNWILGKEFSFAFTRDRLKELLKMTQLPLNEEKIIQGTLDLSQKKVEEVMTPLEDIFKLPISANMDIETIANILSSGYSRIPIYDGNESNICYVLLTKDLALLDPEDKVPVKVLVQHAKYFCRFIPKGMTLDTLLVLFKDGRTHVAFIVDDVTSSDEEKNVIGLITFEDVIEEIFQSEINDETDTYSDNRNKRRLTGYDRKNDFFLILNRPLGHSFGVSGSLKLAVFQFLNSLDVFSAEYISPTVLMKVLGLDIFYTAPGRKLPQDNIYIRGVPADYFVMILEGAMEVRIGNEDLKFEVGSFKYFGIEALKQVSDINKRLSFIPDYTLQAVRKSMYLKLPKVIYEAAILATKFERLKKEPNISINSELYKYYQLLTEADSDTN